MTNPAMNFVAVCANANISISGDKKPQLKQLRELESAYHFLRPHHLLTPRSASLRSSGSGMRSRTPSKPQSGRRFSARLFLLPFARSTQFLLRGRTLRPAKPTSIAFLAWLPSTCPPRCPLTPRPLLSQTAAAAAPPASILVATRMTSNRRARPAPGARQILPAHPSLKRLNRSSTSAASSGS